MKINKILLLCGLLAAASTASAGTFTVYDARSAAMGGTGVASSQIVSAPYYNPAMLSSQRAEEDFALLVGAGVAAEDKDGLFDSLSNFADAIAASDATTADSESTKAGNASPASLTVTAVGTAGWSGTDWSMAITSGTTVLGDVDFTKSGANGSTSTISVSGAQIAETGVALATTFGDYAVGITPKTMNIKSSVVSVSAATNSDFSDIADQITGGTTDHGTDFNMDVGVVYNGLGNIKIGATYQNVLGGKSHVNGAKTFKVQPNLRAGVAYTGDIITLAFDYDLTKSDPFVSGGDSSQYMALGAELDLLDFMQLRAGYNQNTAVSGSTPTTTLGVGFNLLALQLDLTAIQNGESLSAVLQLGARF